MDNEKFELIRQIHLNGIYAMKHVALRELRKEVRDHNTSWWDCRIGVANTALAKKLYYDKLHVSPRGSWILYMHRSCATAECLTP